MTSVINRLVNRWQREWFIVVMALAASAAFAQTGQRSSQTPAPPKDAKPPAFTPSGVQGSTAPSGYSTGVSHEENSAVSQGVSTLTHELLLGYVPGWPLQSCSAEARLVQAVQANPQAYEANRSLGLFYLEHGEFSQSLPNLESAHRLRPADDGSLHALVLALLGSKRNQEAIALLQESLAQSGQDAVLMRLLALSYQLAGNDSQARETYQRAIAASPNDTSNLLAAGLGLIASGGAQQATRLFSQATVTFPDNAKLWLGLGIGQDTLGQKPDAVYSLLKAISIDQELEPAYFFLAALADVSQERAAEVRSRLAEFVVAHPSSAEAHYNYALALWLQGRRGFSEASNSEVESQIKLALASDQNMAKAHYLLGLLYGDAGDLPRAEKELSEAVKLDPGNAGAHYRLAQDYKRDNNAGLADVEMGQFLSLHGRGRPDEPIVAPNLQSAGVLTQLSLTSPCSRKP